MHCRRVGAKTPLEKISVSNKRYRYVSRYCPPQVIEIRVERRVNVDAEAAWSPGSTYGIESRNGQCGEMARERRAGNSIRTAVAARGSPCHECGKKTAPIHRPQISRFGRNRLI